MNLIEVPIQKLKRDRHQPRQIFDQEKIKGMAQSIHTEGIINPIEIDKDFVIITGELRSRAAKLAGLTTVPCKIISINPQERFRRQVIENIHHNTMNDWDTAKAIKKLLDTDQGSIRSSKDKKGGLPDKGIHELSRLIGKSEKYIIEKLSLLKASAPFQQAVKKGLSSTFNRAIKRAPELYREELEQKIIRGDFTNRDHAIEFAEALKQSPEKASAILKAKSLTELYKISPRAHEIVKARLLPTTEFLHLQRGVLEWLKKNKPEDIVNKDRFLLILGMSTMVDNLNAWGNKANQLKLK